ncbi:MAG: histidinol-phosphate aminotransferase [Halieaceae bacterium]|jgi:histidinol-phosphate aminotransferase
MPSRFWSSLVRELHPYTPGEQPQGLNILKLNTNESAYGPSPRVFDAIRSAGDEELRRYPDPESLQLRGVIAAYHGLSPSEVFVGNGSDEVLSHVFLGLFKQERELLFPDISYSFYPVWCQLHAIKHRCIPLRDDFSIAPEDYATDAAAVIFPNPNAPTGRLMPLADIRRMLLSAPDRLLVVDEAYIDFGGDSAVSLVGDFDNLLVVQTLSKSRALAGLRVGLAIGDSALIEALTRVKDSFNSYPLDVLAQRGAMAAYADQEWFDACRGRIIASREMLCGALQSLDFDVQPSAANFIFVRHRRVSGPELFAALRERQVIVRRWEQPRIADYLRITVGTQAQCARLLVALESILGELNP